MTRISFLIVNFFTAKLVVELLESIEKNIRRYEYEILVFDNSCNLAEREVLESCKFDKATFFFSEENKGFVGGNNYLYKKANNELLVLLNPDTRLIDNSLENLFDYVEVHRNVGVAGPMLLNEDQSYQIDHYRFPTLTGLMVEHFFFSLRNPYIYSTNNREVQECDVIKGACLVIRKDIANLVGLFDAAFMMYSEEVDLCYRLVQSGMKNLYFPLARVVHYGEGSTSQERFSEFSVYHYHRSKLIYFRKHFGPVYYWAVIFVILISLCEKSTIFLMFGKVRSARINFNVLKRLLLEFLVLGKL